MTDDEIFSVFLTEFDEFVVLIEKQLANAKEGKEVNVQDIFRAFHTFKGNGALFDLKDFVTYSKKYTEHFRPIQHEKKLSDDNIKLVDTVVGDLKNFRSKW